MSTTRLDVKPVSGFDPQLGLLAAILNEGTREWRDELGEVPEEADACQPIKRGPLRVVDRLSLPR